MWISTSFDGESGRTTTVSSKIGPAEAETYDLDFDGPAGWGGRTMPVPSWVAGAYRTWENGGRLPWAELFEPAIELAEGYPCNLSTWLRIRGGGLAVSPAARTHEGREVWMPGGRFLERGDPVRQPALGRTFRSIAEGGPEAFYEGEFAEHYVAKSMELGGRLSMADMARWPERVTVEEVEPLGDYNGAQ